MSSSAPNASAAYAHLQRNLCVACIITRIFLQFTRAALCGIMNAPASAAAIARRTTGNARPPLEQFDTAIP
jgi:hypothetical protein